MSPIPRLTGEPIMRILCKKTDSLMGYLYKWNNGDVQHAWLNGATTNVRYEPILEAARQVDVRGVEGDLQDMGATSSERPEAQNDSL